MVSRRSWQANKGEPFKTISECQIPVSLHLSFRFPFAPVVWCTHGFVCSSGFLLRDPVSLPSRSDTHREKKKRKTRSASTPHFPLAWGSTRLKTISFYCVLFLSLLDVNATTRIAYLVTRLIIIRENSGETHRGESFHVRRLLAKKMLRPRYDTRSNIYTRDSSLVTFLSSTPGPMKLRPEFHLSRTMSKLLQVAY